AHTYRLLIVKERYSVLLIYCSRAIDKALCLSAAKKEEYEAFSAFRQPSFLLPSPFPAIPLFRKLLRLIGEANYSQLQARKQALSREIVACSVKWLFFLDPHLS
ncbi:hypothetical protein, partial [Janthinobacterium sp.]|uniref:hypothetical protein n=1 Tax=Janthinobacterium sp. TaxID=1871054 RepID=UPI00262114C8